MKRHVRELERLRHRILEIDGTDIQIGELEKMSKLSRKKALAWYERTAAGLPAGENPVLMVTKERAAEVEGLAAVLREVGK